MRDDKKLKVNVDSWEGKIEISILDLISQLDEEGQKKVCDYFTYEHILDSIERQLKHETEFDSWDSSGWRDGQKIREFILKVQGLEPEFKKDLESKIKSLERNVDHYKKYYDWYFKLYHFGYGDSKFQLMHEVQKAIGDVK